MLKNSPFFNDFGRLRSGWRFSIFLILFFVLSYLSVYLTVGLLAALPDFFASGSLLNFILPFAITFCITLFLGWIFGKFLEGLPFRALGIWFTKNWLKDLTFGLIIGALSIALAALIAAVFGRLTFQDNTSAGTTANFLTLTVTLLLFTVAAFAEEILFRGYLLQTLSRAKLFLVGAILTAFLFASAHNGNPDAGIFSWLNTFLAGVWLAIAYYKTRTLWLPVGIHLAWNWVQGAFFGINVSGLKHLATAPLLRVTDTGNEFVTGGDYGIEGGIACTIALAISTAAIYFLPNLKPTEEMLELTSRENPEIAEFNPDRGTNLA